MHLISRERRTSVVKKCLFKVSQFPPLYQSTSNNFHQAVIPMEKYILTVEALPIQKEHFRI